MAQSPAQPFTERRKILIAFIVACAFLMQGIDTTLLTIAIPTIARSLEVDPLLLHLPITAYLLSLAVFMPVSGWFADRLGARDVFCWSLGLFTLGSLLSALSPNLECLVAARILQGIGGAMMTPVGRLLVLKAFGPGRTLDAMTYLTIPVLIGPLAGPLLGALIITVAPWRWIFVVNVPVCIATIVLTIAFIPRVERRSPGRFDFAGFTMVGTSLVLFQLGIEHLARPIWGAAGSAAIFLASLGLFVVYARTIGRKPAAALDLSLFGNKAFAVGVVAGGIGRIGLNSASFLLPLLLQIGFGMSPIAAAALSALAALGSFVAKPALGKTIARFGYATTVATVVVAGSGFMAIFGYIDARLPIALLAALVVVNGTVRTMHFNAVNALTYSEVTAEQLSRSVATAGVFQQLSMGLGVSASAALLAMILPPGQAPAVADFQAVFLVMAAIPLASLPILAWYWRNGLRADRLAEPAE